LAMFTISGRRGSLRQVTMRREPHPATHSAFADFLRRLTYGHARQVAAQGSAILDAGSAANEPQENLLREVIQSGVRPQAAVENAAHEAGISIPNFGDGLPIPLGRALHQTSVSALFRRKGGHQSAR